MTFEYLGDDTRDARDADKRSQAVSGRIISAFDSLIRMESLGETAIAYRVVEWLRTKDRKGFLLRGGLSWVDEGREQSMRHVAVGARLGVLQHSVHDAQYRTVPLDATGFRRRQCSAWLSRQFVIHRDLSSRSGHRIRPAPAG
jgi:hypothetical protein